MQISQAESCITEAQLEPTGARSSEHPGYAQAHAYYSFGARNFIFEQALVRGPATAADFSAELNEQSS